MFIFCSADIERLESAKSELQNSISEEVRNKSPDECVFAFAN